MDINEIRKTLDLFKTDNGLLEVRILSTTNERENYAGIFDNYNALISEVLKFDKFPYNIYFIFNELKDAVSGRACYNKIVRSAKTIKDVDIKYRRWLFIDIDPIREGGVKDIASTNEEMEASKVVAREVRSYLRAEGFPSPVVCESGNGTHLLFRVNNEPNNNEIDSIFGNFLSYLSFKYSTSAVDIDVKVKNAARLTKFYSSTSRKGGDTPTRPHRQSRIIVIPKKIECASLETIKKIADKYKSIAQAEDPDAQRRANSNFTNFNNKEKFNIDNFLSQHGIVVEKEEIVNGNTRKLILKTCPFNEEHGRDSAIFVSDKGIVFTCFHDGCSGNTWRDLRLKFDPHAYDYETAINSPSPSYRPKNNYAPKNEYKIKDETEELGKKWFSMADIKKVDLSSLFCIKTGFRELDDRIMGLYEGEITILSGSNSSGKSSWINNLILNVIQQNIKVALWSGELPPEILKNWFLQCACGKQYLQQSKYAKDKYYVPQNVAHKIDAWMEGKFFLYNNDYSNKWQQIFHDMEEMVQMGVKLFILDNLFSLDIDIFEGDKNNKQKELILQLGEFVKKHKIHIILVCHPRKVTSFLRKNDISGTADLSNAASNVFICHRINKDFDRSGSEFYGKDVILRYMCYGNVIEVCKNRLYGACDFLVGMYYEIDTRRFKNEESEYIHYGWEEQPQEQTLDSASNYNAMPMGASEFEQDNSYLDDDDLPY